MRREIGTTLGVVTAVAMVTGNLDCYIQRPERFGKDPDTMSPDEISTDLSKTYGDINLNLALSALTKKPAPLWHAG